MNIDHNIQIPSNTWSFKGDVAKHFESHIQKSIPLYDEGHELILGLSDFFLTNGSTCYELGCSTGNLTQKIIDRHKDKSIKIIAVDEEPDMIAQAKNRIKAKNVHIVCQDILDIDYEPADLIIAYYTVQFIKPKFRQTLINSIYESLEWGGALLMFEKVRGPDGRFQDMMTTIYNNYKLQNQFTPDQIMTKTNSLRGVLEPFSTNGNLDLLKRAGFVDIMTIMKFVCFEGFLAIK